MRTRWPVFLAFTLAPGAAMIATALRPVRAAAPGGVALGHEVYINEGCIHCHSQYVRPHTVDEDLWGVAREPDFSNAQAPALIGNRRQGPDLMQVSLRRTRDWQRLHLIDPRHVSPHSRMPSYAHLFAPGDPRGEALLDYLDSLGREPAGDPSGSAIAASPGIEHAPAHAAP